jgi:hypothetical protein
LGGLSVIFMGFDSDLRATTAVEAKIQSYWPCWLLNTFEKNINKLEPGRKHWVILIKIPQFDRIFINIFRRQQIQLKCSKNIVFYWNTTYEIPCANISWQYLVYPLNYLFTSFNNYCCIWALLNCLNCYLSTDIQ